MSQNSSFFKGFEKKAEANSLIGTMPGLQPGLRKFQKGGVINNQKALKPGNSIAPKSDMPELATFQKNDADKNLEAIIPPKPKHSRMFLED